MRRPISFLFENSLFLIFGTLAALVWANSGAIESYKHFVHFPLVGANTSADHDSNDPTHDEQHATTPDDHDSVTDESETSLISQIFARVVLRSDGNHQHGITVHFLINDILMAMFFAIAAGEVWEALLPGGSLSNPRKAATPLIATLGGILGPAILYMSLIHI